MSFLIFFTFKLALLKSEAFLSIAGAFPMLGNGVTDALILMSHLFLLAFFIHLNTQKKIWFIYLYIFWWLLCFFFFFFFFLNFFVQWLISAFQLLLQAQVHFLLLLPPLFMVHFRCLIPLYVVFCEFAFMNFSIKCRIFYNFGAK